MTETKEERFRRLAEARTEKAIKSIRLIGALSGAVYKYTPEQIEQIIGALRNAVDEAETRLNTRCKHTFRLGKDEKAAPIPSIQPHISSIRIGKDAIIGPTQIDGYQEMTPFKNGFYHDLKHGLCDIDNFEEYVEFWHDSDLSIPLHDYLGLTQTEYEDLLISGATERLFTEKLIYDCEKSLDLPFWKAKAFSDGIASQIRLPLTPQPQRDANGAFLFPFHGRASDYIPFEFAGKQTLYCAPPYRPGDVVFIKEPWAVYSPLQASEGDPVVIYKTDFSEPELAEMKQKQFRWKHARSMTKENAKQFLRITSVRLEQLSDVYSWEARQEGVGESCIGLSMCGGGCEKCAANMDNIMRLYHERWNSDLKQDQLTTCCVAADPWTWVFTVEPLTKANQESQR